MSQFMLCTQNCVWHLWRGHLRAGTKTGVQMAWQWAQVAQVGRKGKGDRGKRTARGPGAPRVGRVAGWRAG